MAVVAAAVRGAVVVFAAAVAVDFVVVPVSVIAIVTAGFATVTMTTARSVIIALVKAQVGRVIMATAIEMVYKMAAVDLFLTARRVECMMTAHQSGCGTRLGT